jgi:serine/threonine-protein kinase
LIIEPRSSGGLLPALAAAAIIIGAGIGGALLMWPPNAAPTDAELAASRPPTTAPSSAAEPATLSQQAAADADTVRGLAGQWVPQLSAESTEIAVDGVRYDEARILANFRALRAKFPQAALLRSDDYRSFTRPGYWVVVLARSFDDAAAANAWCDRQGLDPDACFAKRLSRTSGPKGNTVTRR